LFITTDKVLAKRWLRQAGLPTPSWLAAIGDDNEGSGDCRSGRYLVKTVYEHGSFGLDDEFMVVTGDVTDVRARIVEASLRLDRECFAERYIEGREFNLSLLASEPRSSSTRAVRAGDDAKAAIAAGSTEYPAVDVLPPAEIDFSAFPPSKLRVVGYRAKWEEGTFEFDHTPRRFDFPSSDSTLLTDLRDLARRCWSLFGLRGCARVDFRVDRDGRPWILEVNANPCLSLDGGFAAAVRQTGLSYDQAIARILADTNTFGTVGDAV
jgi:D-alanine-D-alanine ligase